ncbi:hypothetical protein NEF87_004844 [Candidatus Lokiarchaeum ossiferum]|uniref:Polymerase nucleotidyl transferase domain-containing protein n=1 Tax=Candidatus Lokiarchaeum ossiferum TaxID=2951803 RepID=A0ABY6I164_9ARCH|nr:hypothetical protein NEF87_004844 [Candidatus Lokiarchaeum sp. B-35]
MNKILENLNILKPILIILHGSQVNKKFLDPNLDIDLIVVSNYFIRIIFFDRIKMIQNIFKNKNISNVDVICLTEEEFYSNIQKKSKLNESLKKGYRIISGRIRNGHNL